MPAPALRGSPDIDLTRILVESLKRPPIPKKKLTRGEALKLVRRKWSGTGFVRVSRGVHRVGGYRRTASESLLIFDSFTGATWEEALSKAGLL